MARPTLNRIAVPLAAALAVGFAGTAHAEITGTIASTTGAPVNGAEVQLKDSTGAQVGRDFTDQNGTYEFTDFTIGATVGPYTITVTERDNCRPSQEPDSERTVDAGPVNNPGVLNANLDLRAFCTGFSSDDPTALVDVERQLIVGSPGGRAYLRPERSVFGATNISVTIAGGQVIGSPAANSSSNLVVTLPKPAYNGPFFLNYTSRDGAVISYQLGNIESRTVRRSPAFPGRFDLINIVDVSGSMGGNDREKRRADAMELILGLSSKGDRVGAVGFDNKRHSVFKLQTITPGKVARLGRIARKRTINRGGTDYDVAFDYAYERLTAKGVDQGRPKAAIFLTDGGHNGSYGNSHLKFAYNSTGRTWPVCVVQLGRRSFDKDDVARLKRIARETGGIYVKAPNNAKLTDVYFRCRGTNSGAKTLGKKAWSVRKGQSRVLKRKLPRGLKEATFFAGWGKGTFDVQLRDPKGKIINAAKAKRMKLVSFRRGRTFAFYTVKKPRTGTWRIVVKARKVQGSDVLSTTLTGSKK